ncbi:MAG: NAD-dependent epimerase [Immundisolibacter sp.]
MSDRDWTLPPMRILVTGTAGFIGAAVAERLLAQGHEVIGLDEINDYYDVNLKLARLARLTPHANFTEARISLQDRGAMERLFAQARPQRVIHLAAQAGVRYSLTHPHAYVDANLVGFMNILEGCRQGAVDHLVYASSSSVYGANTKLPFCEHDLADHPLSLYAATKRCNELMAHCYAHLYGLPVSGLRFFTVYGPWGRPDMALFLFTRAILAGEPVEVFNAGHHRRDFTYIDDIVEGVLRVTARVAAPNPAWDGRRPDPATSTAPFRIYNIGNNRPVELLRYLEVLEACLGRKADKRLLPMQPGDVLETCADIDDLAEDVGYQPATPVEVGVRRFVDWYRDYYRV